jgi:acetyl-CoA acetyltransferase
LEAINQAGRAVETDHGDLFVAGGVESMTRGPWVMGKPTTSFQRGDVTLYDSSLGWRFPNKRMGELYSLINNGETAENVAEKYHISREDQDAFALSSHKKALQAQDRGLLRDEIIAVEISVRLFIASSPAKVSITSAASA